MKKIFIVIPGSAVTGGVEVCYQLADALNRKCKRAFLICVPFNRQYETPEPYRRYNVCPAHLRDVEPGSIVVLPEVFAVLVKQFPKAQVYFWWLSVDNFFVAASWRPWAKLLGAQRFAKRQLGVLHRLAAKHMYQSNYARVFLESVSLEPVSRLSDYLANEYIEAIACPPSRPREYLLVYNPAKGLRQTELILQALSESGRPMPNVVPISGMSRDQVLQLLARAKVYIDFGGHPGKDRLPREAAALGACILVNRRGSAANSIDLPIADEFKIEDRLPGFETLAASKIHMLMDDFERQQTRFASYRQSIAKESIGFLNDADAIFPLDL